MIWVALHKLSLWVALSKRAILPSCSPPFPALTQCLLRLRPALQGAMSDLVQFQTVIRKKSKVALDPVNA